MDDEALRLWAIECGIQEFAGSKRSIGGVIKSRAEDFIVNELATSKQEVVFDEEDDGDNDNAMKVDDVDGSDNNDAPFVRFVLQKERMDTLGAIGELSARLGVAVRCFGFAGLKDWRAITTQEITLSGVAMHRAKQAFASQLGGLRLRVCGLRPAARGLKLGECAGNRFRIVLRRCVGDGTRIRKTLRSLKRKGFINYYGLQRFGDPGNGNDELGVYLLRGDYMQAVATALRPMGSRTKSRRGSNGNGETTADDGETTAAVVPAVTYERTVESAESEAREAWTHAGDARTALKLMPRRRIIERSLLQRLADPPRSLRAREGEGEGEGEGEVVVVEEEETIQEDEEEDVQLLVGDADEEEGQEEGQEEEEDEDDAAWYSEAAADEMGFSYSSSSHAALCRSAVLGLPFKVRRLLAHAYFSRLWNLAASERVRLYGTRPAVEGELVLPSGLKRSDLNSPGKRRAHVHRVTAEEATAEAFDASAIVLPLPGCAVLYPTTPDGVLFRQRLFHDGIEPEGPAIEASNGRVTSHNWYGLQGDYRHLMLRPRKMSWRILDGDGDGDASAGGAPEATEQVEMKETVDVALQFDLPPGAYATMAMREVMQPRSAAQRRREPPQRHIRFA